MHDSRRIFWFLAALPMLVALSASAETIDDFQVNENASPDGSEQSEPCIAGDGQGNFAVVWKDKRSGTGSEFWAQILRDDGTALGANFPVGDVDLEGAKYSPAVAVDHGLNMVVCWLNRRFMKVDVYARRVASDGAFIGESFMVNEDYGTIECSCPSVSIDEAGNVTFVWADERGGDWNIYAQRYASDGQALGGNVRVNDDSGSENQYWADSTGDGSGGTIVTWADHRSGNYDIYVQRIASDGSLPGANVRVDTDGSGAMQLIPVVTVGGNGNYVIAWQDNRNVRSDIYAQLYASDGQAMGANILVGDIDPEVSEHGPSVAADLVGNFIVGWSDDRNAAADVFVQRFTSNGTPAGPVIRASNAPDGTSQRACEAAMSDDGRFFVVWEDRRLGFEGDVFAQAFLRDGSQLGNDLKVNDDVGSGDQLDPTVALDGNGHFIVTWVDHPGGPKGIVAQRFLTDGTEVGEPIVVTDELGSYNPGEPGVAFDGDGNFVVAWCDLVYGAKYGSSIHGRRFSSQGVALGASFRVDTGTHSAFGATVACQPDGDFLICWCDDIDDAKNSEPDVYVQHYRSDGSLDGINVKLNDDGGTTSQTSPDIAVDASGNYVIVWSDDRDGDDHPYLQRIASDGTRLGPNQRIESTMVPHYRCAAAVAADDGGNFVVTWIRELEGSRGVYAQRFTHDATELGPVFQVDGGLGDIEVATPGVTVGDEGDFVIAWTEILGEDHDVYGQKYNGDGSRRGDKFLISNTPQWVQTQPDVTMGAGRIIFTWRDNRDGQTQFDIYAKILDWDSIVGVDNPWLSVPASLMRLGQNSPNPFNPSTMIRYRITEKSPVVLDVFSMRGEKIATLVDRTMAPGVYQAHFDAGGLGSGVYFYRLRSGSVCRTRKMVLLK